jgi:hypothetical protein
MFGRPTVHAVTCNTTTSMNSKILCCRAEPTKAQQQLGARRQRQHLLTLAIVLHAETCSLND